MTSLTLFATVAAATVVYLLPFVVAFTRRRPGWAGLLVLNLLIGWTVLGWVAVLVWAASTPKPRPPDRRRLAAMRSGVRRVLRGRPRPVVFARRPEPLVEPPPEPVDTRIWSDAPAERPDPYADWLMTKHRS